MRSVTEKRLRYTKLRLHILIPKADFVPKIGTKLPRYKIRIFLARNIRDLVSIILDSYAINFTHTGLRLLVGCKTALAPFTDCRENTV